jgi:hypothetical protein
MTRTPREVAESYWRAEASRSVEAVLAHFMRMRSFTRRPVRFLVTTAHPEDKFDHVTAYFDPAQFPNPGAGE